jgi:hypothetical protein
MSKEETEVGGAGRKASIEHVGRPRASVEVSEYSDEEK